MTNEFPGLSRGPIDPKASSVITVTANEEIVMGSVVELAATGAAEILPRIVTSTARGNFKAYGIAVGGDADGVYGDGSAGTDENKAATGEGQAVVVVTQGRCPARVLGKEGTTDTAIVIGDKLIQSATAGVLQKAIPPGAIQEFVIATALQDVGSGDTDMIAVDVQREGLNTTV